MSVLALGLASCGSVSSTAGPSDNSSNETTTSPSEDGSPRHDPVTGPSEDERGNPKFDNPPPLTVRYEDSSLELEAYSYCYGNVCTDGFPRSNPPSVGSPEQLLIDFPLDEWSFEATFEPADERCGRMQTVTLQPTGQGSFVLRPAGYAGTYDVTLFGRGDGDLATVFRWTTPSDGPLPAPEAELAVLAGGDGTTDSYGVELNVSNLARTPDQAAATIAVTAANGESTTFEATRSRRTCWAEGTVYWDGPDDQGLAAASLGPPPFTYEVVLNLDGTRYAATAAWPADEIRGNEPSVALQFTPALPALE